MQLQVARSVSDSTVLLREVLREARQGSGDGSIDFLVGSPWLEALTGGGRADGRAGGRRRWWQFNVSPFHPFSINPVGLESHNHSPPSLSLLFFLLLSLFLLPFPLSFSCLPLASLSFSLPFYSSPGLVYQMLIKVA